MRESKIVFDIDAEKPFSIHERAGFASHYHKIHETNTLKAAFDYAEWVYFL